MDTMTNSSDDPGDDVAYGERITVAMMYLIIFLTGIVGNSMVIIAVILSRKLREPTNCLITNLAVSDLLTCLMLIWNVVALLSKSGWPVPDWICSFAGTIIYTSSGTSLYSLPAIALNRLIRITQPNYFKMIFTYRNVGIMIFLTWIIPLPLILIPPLLGIGQIGYDESDYTCSDVELHPKANTFNFFQSAVVPIPLLTIIICYGWILVHIRRHFKIQRRRSVSSSLNRNQSFRVSDNSEYTSSPGPDSGKKTFFPNVPSNLQLPKVNGLKVNGVKNSPKRSPQRTGESKIDRQQMEVTKNLAWVVLAFLICSFPYFVALLLAGSMNTDHFMIYAGAILLASSAVNPLIYAWKHPHFKVVLTAMCLCRYHDIPRPSSTAQRVVKRMPIELQEGSFRSRSNSNRSFPSRSNSKSLPSRPSFRAPTNNSKADSMNALGTPKISKTEAGRPVST